jgi:tRNA threonylcarbamoyladenosine biosynthesis protein TsaB
MLLALDTATHLVGIALHDGQTILSECSWIGARRQTSELAPEVALALRRVDVTPRQLSAVAVAIGPGSFTGLRIGLAFAKGLALAHHIPLVGVPTLDILAWGQPRRDEPMLALLHAGRGRVVGVWYKWKASGWQATAEPEVMTWPEMRERITSPTYVCGELEKENREDLSGHAQARLAPPALCVRRPGVLAEIAWNKLRSGWNIQPSEVVPIYLRTPSEPTP